MQTQRLGIFPSGVGTHMDLRFAHAVPMASMMSGMLCRAQGPCCHVLASEFTEADALPCTSIHGKLAATVSKQSQAETAERPAQRVDGFQNVVGNCRVQAAVAVRLTIHVKSTRPMLRAMLNVSAI
jgi:hypothetical protein